MWLFKINIFGRLTIEMHVTFASVLICLVNDMIHHVTLLTILL